MTTKYSCFTHVFVFTKPRFLFSYIPTCQGLHFGLEVILFAPKFGWPGVNHIPILHLLSTGLFPHTVFLDNSGEYYFLLFSYRHVVQSPFRLPSAWLPSLKRGFHGLSNWTQSVGLAVYCLGFQIAQVAPVLLCLDWTSKRGMGGQMGLKPCVEICSLPKTFLWRYE